MRNLLYSSFSVAFIAAVFFQRFPLSTADEELDFYSFTVIDIHDEIVNLGQYRGKVSLVVNVASECGYTDNHYKSLQMLQDLLAKTKRFNVLAFPCNQFGKQEPASNTAIYNNMVDKYGVDFPMFAKVNVIGPEALDAWKYLVEKSGQEPTWNFFKYLVDHKGHVVKAWGPWMDPDKLYNIITKTIDKAEEEDKAKSKGKKKTTHDGSDL